MPITAGLVVLYSFIFLGSMALQMALRKKPQAPEKNSPNSWSPVTVQRAGIPVELVYGYVKVNGNAFSQYTEIANVEVTNPASSPTNIVIIIINVIRAILGLPPLLVTQSATYITSSKERLNVRLGVGDGPLEGPLEETFVVNDLNIADAVGITITNRLGTDSQTATGMGDIFQFPHEEVVEEGQLIVVTCPDKDYDDAAIILYSPEGLVHYASDGDRTIAAISVKVEIREVGGSWHTLFDGALVAKTTNPIFWRFVASSTYDGGTPFEIVQGIQHEWRISCIKDGSSNTFVKLSVWAGQQIYDDAHTFPGLAFTEIRAYPSEKINGRIEFEGVWKGKIVEDVETGELVWSDNHANVIRDLFCRPCIRGTGDSADPYSVEYYRGYDPSKLNTADLIALKNWCNDLVSDGKGGTEKRFRFNGRFADRAERWEQAAKVAAACLMASFIGLDRVVLKAQSSYWHSPQSISGCCCVYE